YVRLIAALQLRPRADARLHTVLDRERRNLGVLAEQELVDEAQRVFVLKESPLTRSLIRRLAAPEQFKGRKLQGSGFERGLVGNDAHLLVVQDSARQDEREGLSHPYRIAGRAPPAVDGIGGDAPAGGRLSERGV